IQQLTTVTV
ncbi:putative rTX toxin, partial [Vibrio parahaemolyticus IDH02640]